MDPAPCEWTLSKLAVHMNAQNSYPDASLKHLSSDDYDILTACTWTISLAIICVLISCKSLELHHRNNTLHWMNVLLFAAELSTTIVYGLTVTELNDLGKSGKSEQSSRVKIAVFQTIQQTCILLTTLLYTKGWLYGREKISPRGRVFIAIACSTFVTCTLFLLMFSTAGLVVVPQQLPMRVVPYAGSTGILIVVVRSFIASWMLIVIFTTMKRNHESKVGRIGILGIFWLLLPCLVNVAILDQAACSDRPRVITTEAVCTLVLLFALELTLWPYNSSLHILRGRSPVQKANGQINKCLRTGGISLCRICCCPKTLVWVAKKKSIPKQSQEIQRDIAFMHRKIMTLTGILKDMIQQETMHEENAGSFQERSGGGGEENNLGQFGGGIGTMEEVQRSMASAATVERAKDVWENVPSFGPTFTKTTKKTAQKQQEKTTGISGRWELNKGSSMSMSSGGGSGGSAVGNNRGRGKRRFVLPPVR